MLVKQKEKKEKLESCSNKSESNPVHGRFSEGIHRWHSEKWRIKWIHPTLHIAINKPTKILQNTQYKIFILSTLSHQPNIRFLSACYIESKRHILLTHLAS